MDTPVVNGKAYPTLNVDPRPYRFRILNAANDRFQNLSLFVAADKATPTTAGTTGAVLCTDNAGAPGELHRSQDGAVQLQPARDHAVPGLVVHSRTQLRVR